MDRTVDLIKEKTDAFKKEEVAASYEYRRFGREGGNYVNRREKDIVIGNLAKIKGRILDIACGTGRYMEEIIENGRSVIGLDSSMEMLKNAVKKRVIKGRLVQGDAFRLPFADEAFEGIIISRVFQHFKDPAPFLLEAKRVCRREGIIIFDTLKWSPRLVHFWISKNDSRGIFRHTPAEIKSILRAAGLDLRHTSSCFVLSPGLYRFLRGPVVKLLHGIEKILPQKILVKDFWVVNPAPSCPKKNLFAEGRCGMKKINP
jgi:SAM-dependent methyltransferase